MGNRGGRFKFGTMYKNDPVVNRDAPPPAELRGEAPPSPDPVDPSVDTPVEEEGRQARFNFSVDEVTNYLAAQNAPNEMIDAAMSPENQGIINDAIAQGGNTEERKENLYVAINQIGLNSPDAAAAWLRVMEDNPQQVGLGGSGSSADQDPAESEVYSDSSPVRSTPASDPSASAQYQVPPQGPPVGMSDALRSESGDSSPSDYVTPASPRGYVSGGEESQGAQANWEGDAGVGNREDLEAALGTDAQAGEDYGSAEPLGGGEIEPSVLPAEAQSLGLDDEGWGAVVDARRNLANISDRARLQQEAEDEVERLADEGIEITPSALIGEELSNYA